MYSIFKTCFLSLGLGLSLYPSLSFAQDISISECSHYNKNPWVSEVPYSIKPGDSFNCSKLSSFFNNLSKNVHKYCKHTYIDARAEPIREVIESPEDVRKELSFFKTFYYYPSSLTPKSFGIDSTIKFARCSSLAIADSIPASLAERDEYKQFVKIGFHGLALYFVTKSLGATLSPWAKTQQMSFASSLGDRSVDLANGINTIDIVQESSIEDAKENIEELLVEECDIEKAEEELLSLKNDQQRYLWEKRSMFDYATMTVQCSKQEHNHRPIDDLIRGYYEEAEYETYQAECQVAKDLTATWRVYNEVIPTLIKERQYRADEFTVYTAEYVRQIAACNYPLATKLFDNMRALKQTRCGKKLSPGSVAWSSLFGKLSGSISSKRSEYVDEYGMGLYATCLSGAIPHYTYAGVQSLNRWFVTLCFTVFLFYAYKRHKSFVYVRYGRSVYHHYLHLLEQFFRRR